MGLSTTMGFPCGCSNTIWRLEREVRPHLAKRLARVRSILCLCMCHLLPPGDLYRSKPFLELGSYIFLPQRVTLKTALTLGFIPFRCPKGGVVQDDVGLLKRRAADRGILWSAVGRRRQDPWQVKLTGPQASSKYSREMGGVARVGEQRISMCILPYFMETACVNIHLKYWKLKPFFFFAIY